MAIFTERIIRVNNNKASMDKDIYIYRGNRNIEIQFSIMDHQFKFRDVNLVEQVSPSHAYVTLLTPQMKQVGTGKAAVENGVIKLVINSAMIDEKTECGDYAIVIDLYDEVGDALITIPPVENQLHVLDRMTEIDDIPDELRFVFEEETGNLEVVNIDVTYDETSGEIKTIEGIPLCDKTARRNIENLQTDVDEYQVTVDGIETDMLQVKAEVTRISPIVDLLQDNGYSQIKPDMTQEEIQNVLNNGGLILWRAGNYELTDNTCLNLVSNTRILAEKEVIINMATGITSLKLEGISNVSIDGFMTLTGAGIDIIECDNIEINNLQTIDIRSTGVYIEGGGKSILKNITTQNCNNRGCYLLNNLIATNIIIENHTDIQSGLSLEIYSASDTGVAGRVRIINSYYVCSYGENPCVKIDNSINAHKVVLDKPTIVNSYAKDIIVSLIKEEDNTQKLGNVEIIEPHFMGKGEVGSHIVVNNTITSGNIARIKIIKPMSDNTNNGLVKIVGDISSNKSVSVELNPDCECEVTGDMTLMDDICGVYSMPASVSANVAINLAGAPVNHVCEFINNSLDYSFLISATSIDNKSDILELKYNDYIRLKHLGSGIWCVLDENFKNKITTIYSSDDILSIPNARYLFANVDSEVTLELPSTQSSFTEIHLFVVMGESGNIVYPEDVKWTQEEPDLDVENVYEFIFTRVNGTWLIGCVSYV